MLSKWKMFLSLFAVSFAFAQEPADSVALRPEAAENVFGSFRGSSTDSSALASLMPLIHPYFGGAVGSPHGADFEIVNEYAAYVVPAKIAAAAIVDLLWDGAKEARRIKEAFTPAIKSKEEFLAIAERYSDRKAE